MGPIWDRLLQSISPQQVCYVCLLITMGAGFYGIKTFAENAEVDRKIAAATAPLIAKVDHMSALLMDQLANSKAADIRFTISKRCKTQGYVEREELNREKDRLQREYRALRGEFYDEPECADL
jgi:hypothetical protein